LSDQAENPLLRVHARPDPNQLRYLSHVKSVWRISGGPAVMTNVDIPLGLVFGLGIVMVLIGEGYIPDVL
jgi:hypothetical protein